MTNKSPASSLQIVSFSIFLVIFTNVLCKVYQLMDGEAIDVNYDYTRSKILQQFNC